uniref:ZP domain-containing protein n=1 Tax=Caenorhabditis japonica TaxID=281687 RepID=A0A8R1HTN0_CAEJA
MKPLLLIILFLPEFVWAVKPVWRTPVSEPNPSVERNERNHSNVAKRAQPNYYTRPEQVSIPDYRPPSQRIPPPQIPPHQITSGGHFRPFAWVGPQPKADSPQTSYYNQAPNKGQFPNGLPPLPPNWQQYPVQMIWIPDNAVPGGGKVPPNAYYSGPVAPPTATGSYGVYGPGSAAPVSTEEPMKPSANPESYTGTVAHSPSANPITTTVPYEPQNPYGGRQTTSSSYGKVRHTQTIPNPYEGFTQPSYTPTYHENEEDDEEKENTYSPSAVVSSTSQSSTTRNPTIRPGPQESSGGEETTTTRTSLPYDADETISPKVQLPTRPNSPPFEMTENPFEENASPNTVPPVFLGSEENFEEGPEDISNATPSSVPSIEHDRESPGEGHNSTPTPQEEEKEMMKNFFPRPVTSQAYQPPAHQPEDFSSHINVNFKKPPGNCVTPPCHGVDTDKISLYKPDRQEEGSGPTLVISNAAKDDASRAGYKPPPPPLINPYVPPAPPPYPEEEYATPYTVPPAGKPFPPFVPHGPATHGFQPSSPSPSTSTLPPRKEYHETTFETIIPTAQTISTRYTSPPPTTTPRPVQSTTTEEDHPEYVPPAIAHMTPSTPSEKSPPTYRPLHPETTAESETPSVAQTTRPTTPATVTRNPEFPARPSSPSPGGGGNVPPFESSTAVPLTASTGGLVTEVVTEVVTDRERTDSGSRETESTTLPFSTSETTRSSIPSTQWSTPGTFGTSTARTTSSSSPTTRFKFPTLMTSETIKPSKGPTPPNQSTPAPFTPSETSKFTSATTTVSATFPTTTTRGPPGILPNTNPPPRVNPYAPPEGAPRVPNRLIGKPRILCLEDGISFEVKTILPLSGEVFANDRKRIPECQKTFTEDANPKVFLPFATCGVKNVGEQVDSRAQYHMQLVLIIDQGNGTNTLQSFMAQCVHQKINYNKQALPKRIEEALEELRLVPSKLEQKASMPNVQMQIVVDEGHHKLGAEVSAADIGMPLALRWSMVPESDAYGMHVRNCKVVDAVGRIDHTLIDEQGCSADLQIIDHPHYDTYHDTASAHMWAFKVPDMSSLQIKCDILICSNIKSSITNTTSCEDIPSVCLSVVKFYLILLVQPPFCADVVTSPPNSILSDASSFIKHRRASATSEMAEMAEMASTQSVRTSICLSTTCKPNFAEEARVCINMQLATTSTGLSVAFLLFAISFQIIARTKRD